MTANISTPIWLVALLAVGLVGVSALSVVGVNEYKANEKGITATGEYKVFLDPDQATATVRVETRADKAQDARAANAEKMKAIIAALKSQGLTDKDLETTSFNIYQEQIWNPTTGKQTQGQYIATHSLRIRTKDVENVGKYVDVAVTNGANGVDSIQFELSSEKESEYQREALKVASAQAKQKAQAIADGFGVELGDITELSSSFQGGDYPWPIFARAESGAADKVETSNIQPQQLEYVATVYVTYEIDD